MAQDHKLQVESTNPIITVSPVETQIYKIKSKKTRVLYKINLVA